MAAPPKGAGSAWHAGANKIGALGRQCKRRVDALANATLWVRSRAVGHCKPRTQSRGSQFRRDGLPWHGMACRRANARTQSQIASISCSTLARLQSGSPAAGLGLVKGTAGTSGCSCSKVCRRTFFGQQGYGRHSTAPMTIDKAQGLPTRTRHAYCAADPEARSGWLRPRRGAGSARRSGCRAKPAGQLWVHAAGRAP